MNDIDNIYGENEELKTIINKYMNNRKITNTGIILMSLALVDLIVTPILAKQDKSSTGGPYILMIELSVPIAIIGAINYFKGPHKRDLYNSLQKYHQTHPKELSIL